VGAEDATSVRCQRLTTPRRAELALRRIGNTSGLEISLLPNGAIFALEHVEQERRIMINQVLGSPLAGGTASLCLRVGGSPPANLTIAGAAARGQLGVADDRFVWRGDTDGLRYEVSLQVRADQNGWVWRADVHNGRADTVRCDLVLIQDLGLGEPGFLMNNEAYASQYLDQYVARHPRMGHVLLSRQNLPQGGRHPWVAHGCLEGAVGFATDLRQVLGPAHRDGDEFAILFETDLPSIRLQHEAACAALQSRAVTLAAGATTSWSFFGIYQADHPDASGDGDLALIDRATGNGLIQPPIAISLSSPARSVLQDARCAVADPLDEKATRERFAQQLHRERADDGMLSFFVPAQACRRHVVLRDKERRVLRRHGAILVSGRAMLPDESTLCLTCWMHGVFGAQLTIGNTSFHRLFSISRDPYNITRGSGLRMLVDTGGGWRWLTVPSAFEMGLSDCRWIYRLADRTVTVAAAVSGEEPAVQWRVVVDGQPCRFLVFGHLVLGEQEYAHAAHWQIDVARKRFSFQPEPDGLWSQRYPRAVYHLVTSTPQSIDEIGGDELLYADGQRRSGAYAALKTLTTREFAFAVVGSLTDPARAEAMATKFAVGVDETALRASSLDHWRHVTRDMRIERSDFSKSNVAKSDRERPPAEADVDALNTIFPWLVHDAMVHVGVPHGLEQYTGGAWGTRDVCQGPLELFLTLEHDEPARQLLRIVFAQQYAQRGDWPQWFMLEPYSAIQSREAHGDVIVWPLKALCDYVEATGDFAFLDELVPWRREDNLEKTAEGDTISAHVEKLTATVCQRFIPGTHLIRYGNGDWNDSLQPVDPAKRDWMVSSWTVALLYEQLCRYAEILRRAGRSNAPAEERLATAIREDFNRFLIRDGTVAGYGVFSPEGGLPEVLFHPADLRTGIRYSLLPMTQAILGDLFTPEQAHRHLDIIRRHLRFADGVRLMDRPIAYHGGRQVLFQRAESAAFFGREIGLMYTHSHLRDAQAMAVLGEASDMWDALLQVNPVALTSRLPEATLRQCNAYFSSSDAAFGDRYQASAEWARLSERTIAVDGGWRVYSSGPGLYVNVLIGHALGVRRRFGTRIVTPTLPDSLRDLRLSWNGRPVPGTPPR
jgi:1,2-beta-oligoglucan phosphorylase